MSTTQLLVVDDDARYAQSVCELLRLDGHSVECEVDGARALQRIGVGDIAVLILDLDMPGVSGIDVLRAVQTRMSGLKTIIVSGSADIDKIAPVLRFSPFDYLAKPYDPRHLLTSVRGALACIGREGDLHTRFADQAIARLTGGIAHDLNNILADIIGHTELSLGSATDTNHLKEVLAAGQRARDLISQILMLTRYDDTTTTKPTIRTGRVVIVDHEVSVSDCIAEVLKRAGYEVAVFSDAAAALEHIQMSGHDVVLTLTDQALPQLNGEQFAERMRAQIDAPPVVIMVGYAERDERHCTPVLKKPFRVDELLDVVDTVARRAGVQ